MNPPRTDVERDEERDAAVIDRLYGDSDDADLGELRSVRALIARVRDEAPVAEPSPAISATLLQAARARAPREGLWARFRAWMMPITAHPGLAAAATLVVVAGAAALWMRGGGEVAEPTRGPVPEVTREAPKDDLESFETKGTLAETPQEEPMAPAEVAVPEPEKPKRKVPPPSAGERDREEKEQRKLARSAGDDKDEKPTVTVTGKVDGQVGGVDKKKSPVKADPPSPPPPPEPSADDSAGSGVATEEVQIATDQAPTSSAEQARAVTRKARVEAEKNNCKNTPAYATEVKNLDKRVYDRDFVRDRAIDACLRRAPAKTKKSGQ